MSARTVVVSPAPTANGDLHLGHVAGPFLAADVHARYARAAGREVLFGTGAQDTPTYVVTTANRLGVSPADLAERSADDIRATLAALGVDVDGFTGFDRRFTDWVRAFMSGLHGTGALRTRGLKFPYLPRTGEFLVDGYVRGGCPLCLADGCAGLCESCGHPVAPGDLLGPRSTLHPDEPVELREAQVLVLPLEDYRERLREHFARHADSVRPHMAQLVDELLSRPLPDFPVTHPVSWGIPAPFAETPDQVINPNAETQAWSMYSAALAAENRGAAVGSPDELWSPEADSEVVYFLGFDNTFPFAIAGLAMLMAHGDRYALPHRFVTNEFYELDNQKFSTSRGHVVRGRDLLGKVSRDLVRFHLAATSPEHQRTNFSLDALATVTETRLVAPWNAVADTASRWADRGPFPVSDRSHAVAARVVARFAATYELRHFSLNRAAELVAEQLGRLARWEVTEADAGDFWHEVEVFLRCAAPILVDLAAAVLPDPAAPAGPPPAEVTPRVLPRLAAGAV
ncbi:class I tRNA ligase family protein [Saccharothrix obliqua]|uniref:class I tRNA ligase family protein n=1 Tax=Saccharothrix obliqua TaxID=2861747 RepID=UPI001C6015CE|nr:class I tRNA ligase family protein [Saccharothrix obliqua]MBW4718025.1 class I tRNA ligase family protein [Saccharothrix obliqua]